MAFLNFSSSSGRPRDSSISSTWAYWSTSGSFHRDRNREQVDNQCSHSSLQCKIYMELRPSKNEPFWGQDPQVLQNTSVQCQTNLLSNFHLSVKAVVKEKVHKQEWVIISTQTSVSPNHSPYSPILILLPYPTLFPTAYAILVIVWAL